MWPARRSPAMLLVALALSLLLALVAASAQPRAQPARIAFLGVGAAPPASGLQPEVAGFRQGLRELGWVEGQNLTIEWRWAEGSLERFATLVEEMVRLPVEVMVVPNATTAGIAKKATTTIPIVVVAAGSLVESGLVASLARPGGNITGVVNLGPEISTKRLELLKEVLPRVTRVAMLRGLATGGDILPAMEVAARALGVQLQHLRARDPTEIDQAFAAAVREGAGALMVSADGDFFFAHRAQLADLALTHRLPSILNGRAFVEAGGLMSYVASPSDRGQRIAAYVDKILKGATPAELPVEQPTKFELVINLKTAEALGLTIPPMLLFQADEVIR